MSHNIRYVLILLFMVGVSSIAMLSSNELYISFHIADTLHSLEASLRMVDGEVPHLDFMTPIGILGFAPIAGFLAFGFGPGVSLIMSNMLAALFLFPAVAWVGISRFDDKVKWIFGVVVLLFPLAFVYGGITFGTSFSMHYNRWAWALSFVLLICVLLPNITKKDNNIVDALVIGGALSVLALLKATFFLAFGGASLLILLISLRFRLLMYISLVGLVVMAIVTLLFGIDFWFAYAEDMLWVARNPLRPYPDRPLMMVISSPDRILGIIVLLAFIIMLRAGEHKVLGLSFLILMPAFIYITFQNFGNESKWLFVLGLCAYMTRSSAGENQIFGVDARVVGNTILVASVVMFVPIVHVMSTSIVKISLFRPKTEQALPFAKLENDIWMPEAKINRYTMYSELNVNSADNEPHADDRKYQSVNGIPLLGCENRGMQGYVGQIQAQRAFIAGHPELKDAQVVFADTLNHFWLYTDIKRLQDGSPWYYGDNSGFVNAKYYIVPQCPVARSYRQKSLEVMEETGWELELVAEDDDFLLFEIIR